MRCFSPLARGSASSHWKGSLRRIFIPSVDDAFPFPHRILAPNRHSLPELFSSDACSFRKGDSIPFDHEPNVGSVRHARLFRLSRNAESRNCQHVPKEFSNRCDAGPGAASFDLLSQKDRAAIPHRIPGLGAAANSRRYVTKGSGSNEIGRILLPIDV